MYFSHIVSTLILYSVTEQQQQQQQRQQQQQQQEQHIYEHVSPKPLVTGVHKCQVKKSLSRNNDNAAVAVNPTYSDITNSSIKTNEDASSEYEVMESHSRQVKTEDIEVMINPACVQTEFN